MWSKGLSERVWKVARARALVCVENTRLALSLSLFCVLLCRPQVLNVRSLFLIVG